MEIPGYQNIEPFREDEEGDNYLATQKSSGRRVVVKFLSKNLLPDPTSLGSYIEEGQTVSAISHPNIARVHEVGGDGDNVYVVREYVPGTSLGAKYKEMCLLDKIYVIKQIAKTLDYLHSRGCGHFNLKLSNIIISEHDSRVILVGYELPPNQNRASQNLSTRSATYLSPEQIQGKPLDIRSDLYSLGVIFYTLLAGVAPYKAPTPEETACKHLNETIPRLKKSLSMFQNIVDTALAKPPEERFQSGAELTLVLDMLDDEEIIKAGISNDGHLKQAQGSVENDKKDNVVILPTSLSLQAAQSDRLNVDPKKPNPSATKSNGQTNADLLEKLNHRHALQSNNRPNNKVQKKQPRKERRKKPVELDNPPNDVDLVRPADATVSPKNTARQNSKQDASSEKALHKPPGIKPWRAQAEQIVSTATERGKSKLKSIFYWLRRFFFIMVLLVGGLYLGHEKLPDTLLIKPLAYELAIARDKLSGLLISSYRYFKERLMETAGSSEKRMISHQPDKVGGPAIKSAPWPDTSLSAVNRSLLTAATEQGLPVTGPANNNLPFTNSFAERPITQPRIPPGKVDIDWLLQQAAMKYSAGKLLRPADDNAVIFYRQVLVLDAGNSIAADGLSDIKVKIIEQVTSMLDNGQLILADALLTRMNIFFEPELSYEMLNKRLYHLQMQKTSS